MAIAKLINLTTIRNKKEIVLDGVEMLDFCGQVIDIKTNLRISRPPVVVSKEFEGRPDLISKLEYGSEDYTDLLLFFNGIGNALTVEAGTILIIYELDDMIANTKKIVDDIDKNESKEAFNNKLAVKDKNRLKQLLSTIQKVPVEQVEIRSPNLTGVGTQATTPVDGRIILGTNITSKCENGLSPTQKLSEQIRAAVKTKIESQNI